MLPAALALAALVLLAGRVAPREVPGLLDGRVAAVSGTLLAVALSWSPVLLKYSVGA